MAVAAQVRLCSLESVGALVFQSPTGLAPMKGIPMVAQAVLHREILQVHASLNLILHVLRTPLAIVAPSFLEGVTFPE